MWAQDGVEPYDRLEFGVKDPSDLLMRIGSSIGESVVHEHCKELNTDKASPLKSTIDNNHQVSYINTINPLLFSSFFKSS